MGTSGALFDEIYISRDADNNLYGNAANTHVNLGISSQTGKSGFDRPYASVGGGISNTADGGYATIAGGESNSASGTHASIGGGESNIASDVWATVSAGYQNVASGSSSTVGGGRDNTASVGAATVGGGRDNTASGTHATVVGGIENEAAGKNSSILGGRGLIVSGQGSMGFRGGDNSSQITRTAPDAVFFMETAFCVGEDSTSCNAASYTSGVIYSSAVTSTGNITAAAFYGDGSNLTGISGSQVGTSGVLFDEIYLSRDADNNLYGNAANTHVNLGISSNTGAPGQNYTYATVGGGASNVASHTYSTVGGGDSNTASGYISIIGGGIDNIASNFYSTVGGGNNNEASGISATIAGGQNNVSAGSGSTVGGGQDNDASNGWSTIAGGKDNLVSGPYSFVGAGRGNKASATSASVAGGEYNTASFSYATVGGGLGNEATDTKATVSGGGANSASSDFSSIGGGNQNSASGTTSTIAGGVLNTAAGDVSTIGGGYTNLSTGTASTVAGGYENHAWNYYSVVAGGFQNVAGGNSASILGGGLLNASGDYSSVAGGSRNTASADYSSVLGGEYNEVAGMRSAIVGGRYLKLTGDGSLGFRGGSSGVQITRTAPDTVYFMETALCVGSLYTDCPETSFDPGTIQVKGPQVNIAHGGEARYRLFNGGGIAEWIMGQKSSSEHNFILSKLVSSVEADYVTVTTSGNVSIGTTGSVAKLTVEGERISIYRYPTAGEARYTLYNGGATAGWLLGQSGATEHNFTISKDVNNISTDYFTVTTSGNVGIGTSSPASVLEVNGTATVTDLEFSDGSTLGGDLVAFSAYRTTSTQSVGNSVETTIIYNAEDFDYGSNYDTSNGIFTAPVTGIYRIEAQVYWLASVDQSRMILTMKKNGTINIARRETISSGTQGHHSTVSKTLKLTTNDTLKIIGYQTTGSSQNVEDNDEDSFFEVLMIRKVP